MGKPRVIAETGAGQHGVATATVCAMLGLECVVYMGEEDVRRQALNVFRMKLLGAEVRPVASGSRTLKDAINEAIRDWVTNVETTHYLIGSVVGPHPYPMMVRDFQSRHRRRGARADAGAEEAACPTTRSPASAAAPTRSASSTRSRRRRGGAARRRRGGGRGPRTGRHAATLSGGQARRPPRRACPTSCRTRRARSPRRTRSRPASTTPASAPSTPIYKDSGRAEYVAVTDRQALEGFTLLCETEGIIPALESSHAIYYAAELAKTLPQDEIVLICLSGRGDKDMDIVMKALGA